MTTGRHFGASPESDSHIPMPKLFGFEFNFNRKSSAPVSDLLKPTSNTVSFVPPDNQDGALNVQFGTAGGYFGYYLDLDGTVVDDFQLINRYREMQIVAEVDEAIDQIINEIVVQDADRLPVSLNLDFTQDLSPEMKARIHAEFTNILKMLNFHRDAYSILRQWYIDGRLYLHCVVDESSPKSGIQELRIVDPRTIRKVREVARKRHQEAQVDIVEVVREYYVYNPMGFVAPTNISGSTNPTAAMLNYNGIRIASDSIAFCPSGLYDANKRTVLSWLHKAIKPLNLLRMIEDSTIVYRVSRAPERRVFYIDVGNLPKQKAEQYLYDIMQKYRNKLVYDVATGEIRDDRKFMSMLEDFWLPRREGGKGTEITTLPGGQSLAQMDDVDYFRRKLYRALGLPPSRIDQGQGFNLGRASEITRDELRFNKYVHRLQTQFNYLFDQLIEKQLRLKNVMTEDDWYAIKDQIRYTWQQDSYFEELKMNEIMTTRLNLAAQIDPYVGRYYSEQFVKRNILRMTEDEIVQIAQDNRENPPTMVTPDGQVISQFDRDADATLQATNNSPSGNTNVQFSPPDGHASAESDAARTANQKPSNAK